MENNRIIDVDNRDKDFEDFEILNYSEKNICFDLEEFGNHSLAVDKVIAIPADSFPDGHPRVASISMDELIVTDMSTGKVEVEMGLIELFSHIGNGQEEMEVDIDSTCIFDIILLDKNSILIVGDGTAGDNVIFTMTFPENRITSACRTDSIFNSIELLKKLEPIDIDIVRSSIQPVEIITFGSYQVFGVFNGPDVDEISQFVFIDEPEDGIPGMLVCIHQLKLKNNYVVTLSSSRKDERNSYTTWISLWKLNEDEYDDGLKHALNFPFILEKAVKSTQERSLEYCVSLTLHKNKYYEYFKQGEEEEEEITSTKEILVTVGFHDGLFCGFWDIFNGICLKRIRSPFTTHLYGIWEIQNNEFLFCSEQLLYFNFELLLEKKVMLKISKQSKTSIRTLDFILEKKEEDDNNFIESSRNTNIIVSGRYDKKCSSHLIRFEDIRNEVEDSMSRVFYLRDSQAEISPIDIKFANGVDFQRIGRFFFLL